MKKIIAVLVMASVGQAALAATAIGPPRWTQYRMGPTSNAVYRDPGATGDKALPSHVYHTKAPLRATPVIVNGRLYIGNHKTGGLQAFDLLSGRMLWHNKAPNWVHSEMTDAGGLLYVGYGDRVFVTPWLRGEGPSGVLALNPDTGKIVWQFETVGEVMPTPAYRNGIVYVTTGAGELYALDAETGAVRWQLPLRTDRITVDTGLHLSAGLPSFVSMSSPHIKDGVLYVGGLDTVFAIDLATHKVKWKFSRLASFTDVPVAISKRGVIVTTGVKVPVQLSYAEIRKYGAVREDYHFIYAINPNGSLRWKHLMGPGSQQENNTSGAPAIAHGRVYVGSPYAEALFAYDVSSGKLLWKYFTGVKIKGPPAIVDGFVFFGDTRGTLYVLNATTGKLIRKRHFPDALAPAGPVVIDQNLYVGCQDGNVYSIPLKELTKEGS
ncbi:MAG TPA: PQQ-binding-like beta-propeller repeat protein [Gammaproteobacteria bacterium]|nr:PQQ-binding-like beta-propeller repeat protein [Gammaproteobacteria bacterium]